MSGRAATDEIIAGDYAMSVGLADMPTLPGWQWVCLTDIARLETGHTPSRKHPEYWDGDIPWVGIRDANVNHGGIIDDTFQHVTELGLENSAARLLPANTVCLSRTASVGYVVILGRPMATSQDFVCWVCSDAIIPQFLMYLLLAETDSLPRFGRGSTHTTIYFPEVKAFHICLPPLAEQRRIVGKLELLLGKVSSSQQRLSRVPKLLKRFRQSVLAAACSGKLTADWREITPEDSVDARLKELSTERRRRWLASKADRRVPDYEEPNPPNNEEPLFSIPDSWIWMRAEQVCDFITKGTTPSAESMTAGSGEIPYIKVYNLTDRGHLDFANNPTFISRQTHESGVLRRSRILPGDVLMNLVGPPLGKVSLVPTTFPEWNTNQAVAIYRPVNGMWPQFLAMSLLTRPILEWAMARSKATVGQHNLTLELARNLRVPLPPLAEQQEIVRRVEKLFAFADQIEERLKQAQAHVDRLTQSILAKAFRGELVPTEAELARREGRDYESASALLAKIGNQTILETSPAKRRRAKRV